jgi:WD40 repeat protein
MGRHIVTYQGHADFVEGVAWSPDSTRVVSGSADGTAQIWDATTGDHIYTYRGHIDTYRSNPSSQGHPWVNRVSWSPDGSRIASCDQFSVGGHVATVQIWEVETGKTLLTYKGHTNGVFTVAWSPNGKYIASCGYDTTLRIWEPINGNLIVGYQTSQALFGLAWAPDSTRIVVGGTGSVVWVVKADVEKLIYSYNMSNSLFVADVAWSPDGTHITAGGQETAHILNASNGSKIYAYERQLGAIDALCWSPDSKRIASGSDDSTVQVWEAV